MSGIFDFLIGIVAVIGMSALCAIITKRVFSLKLFLTAMNLGFCILMWQGLLPMWMIVVVILSITAMLFAGMVEEKTGVQMPSDISETGDLTEDSRDGLTDREKMKS